MTSYSLYYNIVFYALQLFDTYLTMRTYNDIIWSGCELVSK